jgi:hypothetical protein
MEQEWLQARLAPLAEEKELTRRRDELNAQRPRSSIEMEDGTQVDDDPNSEAGNRTASLPAALRIDTEAHVSRFAQPGPSGRLFIGPRRRYPTSSQLQPSLEDSAQDGRHPDGLGLHLHDLRHTGSTWGQRRAVRR